MDSVKNEILNVICKFISNPLGNRNNIALYGKAGIAKSKFIQVLADTLNIPLKSISLGGIKDSSFFLGHGYVYVESGPGKILQNVIDAKISNPIFYFDELDKVSETDNGKDIYSFLCYLTDPTQNTTFTDHYFYGMKFDLSKIFYVFTFNNIEKIDKILLDRLNVIYVDAPNDNEIIYILQNHSIPEILKNIGINYPISINDEDISSILTFSSKYIDKTISSGIREYYRILEKIFLEINKELLLGNIVINNSYKLPSKDFYMYFNRIKTQLTGSKEYDDRSCYHMYI
jgi:ATP-dependent Lon protease